MKNYDLIVIGGGPAGMATAHSAERAGVKSILVLERYERLGGILNQCIHQGFGLHYFKSELTGPEYVSRFKQLLKRSDIEVKTKSPVIRLSDDNVVTFCNEGGIQSAKGRHVVIATGCRERTREMLAIPGSRPAGVMTAGLAQEMVNIRGLLPGKKVVIVGSGDIGLIMARRLTIEGAKVKAVLEVKKELSGLVRNKVQCLDDFCIPLLLEHSVTEIIGRDRVESVIVRDNTKDDEYSLECDTVLFSVGLIPERELITDNDLDITPKRHLIGNADHVYGLVDEAAKDAESLGTRIAEEMAVG